MDEFPHTCKLKTKIPDLRIPFSAGWGGLIEREVLTGAASGAAGTIKQVIYTSGSLVAGTAAGYVVVSLAPGSGAFIPSERLTVPPGGSAIMAGPAMENLDAYKVATTSEGSIDSLCRFYYPKPPAILIMGESGPRAQEQPIVLLPPSCSVSMGQILTTTEDGFAGTYSIKGFRRVPGDEGVEFVRAQLEEVA